MVRKNILISLISDGKEDMSVHTLHKYKRSHTCMQTFDVRTYIDKFTYTDLCVNFRRRNETDEIDSRKSRTNKEKINSLFL